MFFKCINNPIIFYFYLNRVKSTSYFKICWACIVIVSIGSCICSFRFLPMLVRDRLLISVSLRVGRFPLRLVSKKLRESLFVSPLTKNLRKFSGLIILNISFLIFFVEITYGTIYRYFPI